MLTPTQSHHTKGTISSPRPRPLKNFPSRKRRKVSADVGPASGGKARLQQVLGAGGGLGERLRVQGQAMCVSCHRSLSLVPPTMRTNTRNTSFTTVNFTANFKASGAMSCALCGALTCVICSRQCTSTVLPHDSPLHKRTTALVHMPASAATGVQIDTPRRRKEREDATESEDSESSGGTGCGRTLCGGCCVENETTQSYMCLECRGTRE